MNSTVFEAPQASPFAADCPALALRFASPALQFERSQNREQNTKSRDVEILARTPDALFHWYWGWCVHDFSGMSQKPKIVLDWCHDDDEIIGYADRFSVGDSGLTVRGRIESIEENDAAEKLLKRADKGIPFESSIYFEPSLLEFVPEGMTREVNGREMVGPLTIFKQWSLRALSVCPHGYDYGTETRLTAKPDGAAVILKWENTMGATTTAEKEKVDLRAELKKFTDRFGPVDGLGYFNGELSMEEATAKHLAKVVGDHAAEIAKMKADHDAAVDQLAASHASEVAKLSQERDQASRERDEALTRLTAARGSLGEAAGIETNSGGARKLAATYAEARAMRKP